MRAAALVARLCAMLGVGAMASAQPGALTVAGPITTVPTFECLSLKLPFTGDANGNATCVPYYRAQGVTEWREGHALWPDRRRSEFRGSLVGLRPDTVYEVELRCGDAEGVAPAAVVRTSARTWSEDFPIADTVWIEPGTHAEPLLINRSGAPGGYVLYSARPGREQDTIIDVQGAADNDVTVNGDYVIVRGLTLRNAATNAIDILRRHHVVVERCTITGWGRQGGRGQPGELDAGVCSRNGGAQLVIQDNVIREPRSAANTWAHGHPEGPQAISLIQTGGNHVIRYNDLTSTDEHRYNDTLGGGWNQDVKGFCCRDSDIYANHVAYCQDDGIEVDGGAENIRVWGNRIEKTYCGISLAPVIVGPTYVWRNVITDIEGAAFKLGEGERNGYGAVYLYHNTVYAPGKSGIADWGGQAFFGFVTSRNNILAVGNGPALADRRADPTNSYDYDLLQGRVKLATPTEPHAVKADPGFVDALAGVFLLDLQSAAIDAGAPLPGFNDGFAARAPDLGACELGSAPPHYGPRAIVP